jgi:hypothetical protein
MGSFKKHVFVIVLLSCYLVITATVSPSTAQNQSSSNTTVAHKMGVKIISPLKNTTVPAGQLMIHGISSDTPKINCRVFVDWNDLKPMQNVTAKGQGGPNDYSNWTYTYNETYHNITTGMNELTSKITCYDNPSNITSKYFSVNVTGNY